jgi:RNA-binding protein NOB1
MADTTRKPVHTLILDAAPLLTNIPPLSSLLAKCETLVTCPSVLKEIRDATARQRVETLYMPFLVLRSPKSESLKHVSEFARKTGDKSVLSGVDLEILALAYEIECERNGGDWRLRNVPGQKGPNGQQPAKKNGESGSDATPRSDTEEATEEDTPADATNDDSAQDEVITTEQTNELKERYSADVESTTHQLNKTQIRNDQLRGKESLRDKSRDPDNTGTERSIPEAVDESSSDSDSEGWITPSNIKKHQALEQSKPLSADTQTILRAATITSDFAMQNVLLRMNLNLLSPTNLQRVRHLKTYILRCHACFLTTKEMDKQFCPRCGKPTLTRVSCSTNSNGEFKMHLKRNFQYNSRGDRYTLPKPVHGSASGKVKNGGGKDGWGQNLILAEDQKEYIKALNNSGQRSRKERDLMDDDFLPGILTGERRQGGGRVKVGAGRNINSRKR